jgi:hypothetical protein
MLHRTYENVKRKKKNSNYEDAAKRLNVKHIRVSHHRDQSRLSLSKVRKGREKSGRMVGMRGCEGGNVFDLLAVILRRRSRGWTMIVMRQGEAMKKGEC